MIKGFLYHSKYIVFLLMLLTALILSEKVNAQAYDYLLKAGYVEKISHFIDWPDGQNNTDSIFKIVVFGEEKYSQAMEEIFNKIKVKDKKVKIITITSIQELSECQILFIPGIKPGDLNKVLKYVVDRPILTISDGDGFAEAGCFINFYEFENKLRFEINQKKLEDTGFTIDYQLLRVAKVLNPVVK